MPLLTLALATTWLCVGHPIDQGLCWAGNEHTAATRGQRIAGNLDSVCSPPPNFPAAQGPPYVLPFL